MDREAGFWTRTGGFVLILSHYFATLVEAEAADFVTNTHFPIPFCLIKTCPLSLVSLSSFFGQPLPLAHYCIMSSWTSPRNRHMAHTRPIRALPWKFPHGVTGRFLPPHMWELICKRETKRDEQGWMGNEGMRQRPLVAWTVLSSHPRGPGSCRISLWTTLGSLSGWDHPTLPSKPPFS